MLLIFVIFTIIIAKTTSSSVQSCYACVGVKSECANKTDLRKMDCNTFKIEGKSLSLHAPKLELLEKFDNEVGPRNDDTEIGCLTLSFTLSKDKNEEYLMKTCIPSKVYEKDICDYFDRLVTQDDGKQTNCHYCRENDCNSAISTVITRSPILILALTLIIYAYN